MRGFVKLAAAGALTLITPASGAPAPGGPSTTSLTVRIQGLKNDRGQVAVALFASAVDFPDGQKALQGQIARIKGRRAAVTFRSLRPGTYALAVLHDENENGKMDFNFLGMPLEGYGFSNDASAPFGPPSFQRAAFRLLPRSSELTISARYFSF